jgi:DNA polymerase III alpha subunit
MIPIFKSDFSIGKSILRLDEKSFNENSESSIFKILKDSNLTNLVLVEDTMTGFLEAHHNCLKFDINLIFGLNIFCDSLADKKNKDKYIIFSKNKDGCIALNKIYSFIHSEEGGFISLDQLKEFWSNDVSLYIPFYDSFLYNNFMYFTESIPDLEYFNPTFFIENNNLPFDSFIKSSVESYCKKYNYTSLLAKSIFYNKKTDFSAFQVYKCLCSRNFSNNSSIESPNLDHCSSSEFSFESYLQHEST